MSNKTTKRALLTSVISMLVCIVMLVGTTFAWFTDSVSSVNNIIKSGNLDIELEYSTDCVTWNKVSSGTEIFDDEALWEPGYTQVVYFRVSNLGTLALKYQFSMNIYSETLGTNVYDESFKLSEYIMFDVIEGKAAKFADRKAAIAAVTEPQKISAGYSEPGEMEAGDAPEYAALVVYMPETTGNVANHKTSADASVSYQPEIKFGVNLIATQKMSEDDSFGIDYDKLAEYSVTSASELKDALKMGGNIKLGADITLTEGEMLTVDEGTTVVLDLGGNTIEGGYQTGNTEKHVYAIENHGTLTLTGNGTVTGRGVGNYGDLTIENGTYDALDSNGGGAVWNYTGGNVVINGGVFNAADDDEAPGATAINIANGSTAVINGGTFIGGADQTYAVINSGDLTINYATMYADHGVLSSGGKMTVNGGTFVQNGNIVATSAGVYVYGGTTTINGGTFIHNVGGKLDSGHVVTASGGDVVITDGKFTGGVAGVLGLYDSNSTLKVTGGTFSGDVATYVADGCKTVESNGTYSVVADDTTVSSTPSDINNAMQNGDDVVLDEDVSAPVDTKAPYGNNTGFVQKGGVFNGNGNTITFTDSNGGDYGILTYGGTIKNVTVEAVERGIVIYSPAEDVIVDNVNIRDCGYAINTAEHPTEDIDLYVNNSTIEGWSSMAGLANVYFNNTDFSCGTYWQTNYNYDKDYDRLVKPYNNAEFTNCTFEKGFYIDLSAHTAGSTVILENCTVDGVVLTADNYADYVTIENYSADYVIFK